MNIAQKHERLVALRAQADLIHLVFDVSQTQMVATLIAFFVALIIIVIYAGWLPALAVVVFGVALERLVGKEKRENTRRALKELDAEIEELHYELTDLEER